MLIRRQTPIFQPKCWFCHLISWRVMNYNGSRLKPACYVILNEAVFRSAYLNLPRTLSVGNRITYQMCTPKEISCLCSINLNQLNINCMQSTHILMWKTEGGGGGGEMDRLPFSLCCSSRNSSSAIRSSPGHAVVSIIKEMQDHRLYK